MDAKLFRPNGGRLQEVRSERRYETYTFRPGRYHHLPNVTTW
jgi:hypothetical protein